MGHANVDNYYSGWHIFEFNAFLTGRKISNKENAGQPSNSL